LVVNATYTTVTSITKLWLLFSSVIQFCSKAFALYAQATAVQEIFGLTLESLRGIKYLFKYAHNLQIFLSEMHMVIFRDSYLSYNSFYFLTFMILYIWFRKHSGNLTDEGNVQVQCVSIRIPRVCWFGKCILPGICKSYIVDTFQVFITCRLLNPDYSGLSEWAVCPDLAKRNLLLHPLIVFTGVVGNENCSLFYTLRFLSIKCSSCISLLLEVDRTDVQHVSCVRFGRAGGGKGVDLSFNWSRVALKMFL
jgi:hypothetical protein